VYKAPFAPKGTEPVFVPKDTQATVTVEEGPNPYGTVYTSTADEFKAEVAQRAAQDNQGRRRRVNPWKQP
jgi:hypothetical protein